MELNVSCYHCFISAVVLIRHYVLEVQCKFTFIL